MQMKVKAFLEKKTYLFVILLSIILVISMITAVGIGAVDINFKDVWMIIFEKLNVLESSNGFYEENIKNIVWQIRLPRVILSAIVGGGLALSGVAMQSFTKNPLADPYVLGISSGASAGAVLAVLTTALNFLGIYKLPVGAFLGALISIILVYSLAKTSEGILPIKLILTGVAISSLFSALTNYLIVNANNEAGIRNATFWMMGGLSGSKWVYILAPFLTLIISIIVMLILSRALDTMLMGDNTAITLGVNIKNVRRIIIVISALLTGTIVSVSGSIGFVGLIIPHIVRGILGSKHIKVIPVSVLLGSIFIVWTDVIARVISAPEELPIGIITALLGAPFFIWLVRKNNYSFGD